MNNLSNEIVRLSKVLEKQIPKGYHEIVTEYVRQNIVGAVYDLLAMVLCLLVIYFIARTAIKANKDKENSVFYDNGYGGPELSGVGITVTVASGVVVFFALIIFTAAILDTQTSIQHAVAPNYYLIKSLIK